MLIFQNKASRDQYYRLRWFYSKQMDKINRDLETSAYYGDYKTYRLLVDDFAEAKRFFYLEDYCMNSFYVAKIFAQKGDFTGFDVNFVSPTFDDYDFPSVEKSVFSAGFINHGTIRKPSWGLHS